jgi:hypothetical protein
MRRPKPTRPDPGLTEKRGEKPPEWIEDPHAKRRTLLQVIFGTHPAFASRASLKHMAKLKDESGPECR